MSFRIDGVRPAAEIQKADRASNVRRASSIEGKMDAVALSSVGRDYQVAVRALKDVPDVREDRVNDVLEKIGAGDFNLNADDIAGRLLSLFDGIS